MLASRSVLAMACALVALLVTPAIANAAPDRVVVTGGTVVTPGQTVNDVIVVDGTAQIFGHVTGDVVTLAGPARVAGRIDGDLITASDRAYLAPTARVGGDLRYGDEKPVIAPGARVAGDVVNEDWSDTFNGWGWVSSWAFWLALSVSSLVVGLLMVWLAPRALRAADRAMRENVRSTIFAGVIIDFLAPFVVVGLLFTLVGIPLAAVVALAAVPVLVVAYMTSAWILGNRLMRGRSDSPWMAMLVGWGIFRVLAIVPVLGELVAFVATILGVGALFIALWHARSTPVAPGGEPQRAPAPAATA